MTVIEEDLADLTFLDSEAPHVICCRDRIRHQSEGVCPVRFLCGLPYHPEMGAPDDVDDDELCRDCVNVGVHMLCPPMRPTHMHCPFSGDICP